MNDISWGTREVNSKKTKAQIEQEERDRVEAVSLVNIDVDSSTAGTTLHDRACLSHFTSNVLYCYVGIRLRKQLLQ